MYAAAAVVQHTSHLTFGRQTAQFKQLIAFMAIVSIVTWSIVIVTIVIRMIMCHIWYRKHYAPSRIIGPPM
jgi:membrane protein insertase Oxa1/YidC/SpoIIIJ